MLVEATPLAAARLIAVYRPVSEALAKLAERYGTEPAALRFGGGGVLPDRGALFGKLLRSAAADHRRDLAITGSPLSSAL